MSETQSRERFASRFGFIMISAGCAIGLGNVWRFPYITGEYGGAAFLVLYLVFLCAFGLPIMVMEFAVGRAGRAGAGQAFNNLEKPGSKWHLHKWVCLVGNYILMMFYTTVTGWFLAYIVFSMTGTFDRASANEVANVFSGLLADPLQLTLCMLIVVAIGYLVTRAGVENGVEKITKWMMVALFVIMVVLCIHSLTLSGAAEGLAFYLMPDFGKIFGGGWQNVIEVCFAAMGQAFFTLSIGIGGMLIFGSYIDKEHTLPGEALRICGLDTAVAFMAGLIIFPACFTYGIQADSGPGLVFVTLPTVFSQMPLGNLWGSLFFIFMAFAALSTVIGVFEAIIAWGMDHWGWSRKKSCAINCSLLAILSMPCVLGFNVWAGFTIPGIGDIQAIEDFIVSNNLLPLGSLVIVLFCTRKSGWGWEGFLKEADEGKGLKFPQWLKGYMSYFVPIFVFLVILSGYIPIVSKWFA